MGIREYEKRIEAALRTKPESLVGLTIAKVIHTYGDITIGFTDGTFAIILLDRGGWDDMSEIVLESVIKDITPDTLAEAGVLTEAEARDLVRLREKSANDSHRAYQRREYEKLKRIFEND